MKKHECQAEPMLYGSGSQTLAENLLKQLAGPLCWGLCLSRPGMGPEILQF